MTKVPTVCDGYTLTVVDRKQAIEANKKAIRDLLRWFIKMGARR
jgi:hypothetical protein